MSPSIPSFSELSSILMLQDTFLGLSCVAMNGLQNHPVVTLYHPIEFFLSLPPSLTVKSLKGGALSSSVFPGV